MSLPIYQTLFPPPPPILPLSSAVLTGIACDVSKGGVCVLFFLCDDFSILLIQLVKVFRKEMVIPVHNTQI